MTFRKFQIFYLPQMKHIYDTVVHAKYLFQILLFYIFKILNSYPTTRDALP